MPGQGAVSSILTQPRRNLPVGGQFRNRPFRVRLPLLPPLVEGRGMSYQTRDGPPTLSSNRIGGLLGDESGRYLLRGHSMSCCATIGRHLLNDYRG